MEFYKLASLLSELENTSKRLEMIDILANFFKEIKNNKQFSDLDKIIYLLQGQLVSNIKQAPKMGIAEKMIIEALSLHSGISRESIKEILVRKGDIGATAEIILLKKKKQTSLLDFNTKSESDKGSLDVSDLYSELEKISLTSGAGSNDIKLGILRGLMKNPLETKYILRIITSTLRVGVSTQTIIEGLALGFTDSKENKKYIERAFNLHPDLGDIVKILAEKGIEAVEGVMINYGTPIRMMLASRVPYNEIIHKLGSPFIAEYKLDGERLQIHKNGDDVKLFSRRLLEISEQYPDVCDIIRTNINAKDTIIEGEVVAMDPFYEKMLPFQVLSKRRRKYNVEEMKKEVPVCLFLFDLLKIGNVEYIDKSLSKRRKNLEKIVKERDELRLVKSSSISSTEELVDFFNEARERGNEGIMAKSIQEDSVYQPGNRGFLWVKLKGLEGGKLLDSVDVVLIGAFFGTGRRAGVYGTYLGALYDDKMDKFEAFTRIGAGFSDEDLISLKEIIKSNIVENKPKNVSCGDKPDKWIKPEIVVEIIGDEITLSDKFSSLGYSMRFPVFQRLRPEKGPTDITTVDEIINLYETQ